MPEPTYDIFSGTPEKGVLWLTAVSGLSNARAAMQRIAEQTPERYFLFDQTSQSVTARIETFRNAEPSKSESA